MLTIPKPRKTLQFQVEGSPDTYEIPYPSGLGIGYARRLQALGAGTSEERAVAFMDILTDVLDEYAPGASAKLSAEGIGVLLTAWAKEGNLGE